jgi:hypothetical protein
MSFFDTPDMARSRMRLTLGFVAAWVAACLSGCSAPEMLVRLATHPRGATINEYDFRLHQPPVHTFDQVDVAAMVKSEQRSPKVDNLLVVLDTEGLKGRTYRGIPADQYGREVLRRFHRTLPDAHWRGDLFVTQAAGKGTALNPDQPYAALQRELEMDKGVSMSGLSGTSLGTALDQLADESVRRSGRVAVVVITGWDRIDQAAENAVMRLRQRHESAKGLKVAGAASAPWEGKAQPGVCFYAVGVGNAHSRERLYTPESCGSFWAGDALMQPAEMAGMVLDVLYGLPVDDDGDGVPNYLDHCSQTPPGRTVTSQGCLRFPSPDDRQGERQK